MEQLYSRLKELAQERHEKLDESLKLFQFHREIQDLESWIADREVVASSQDNGLDYDYVQMLEERFDRYALETRSVGSERVESVNAISDQLIGTGHGDANLIAEWRDSLNEAWESLLELLDTRKQVCLMVVLYHDKSLCPSLRSRIIRALVVTPSHYFR